MNDADSAALKYDVYNELKEALKSALTRHRYTPDTSVEVLDEPKESWRFWRWLHTNTEQAKLGEGFVLLVESNRIAFESRFKGRFRAEEINKFALDVCFAERYFVEPNPSIDENSIRLARLYIDRLNRS